MAAVAFDLRHPELVAHELDRANRRLAREEEVSESIALLVEDLSEQLSDTDAQQLEAIDPYLWIELQRAAIKALHAVREEDPQAQRRQVRIALEQLRFLLTRLGERQAFSDDQPIGDIVKWLNRVLTVPHARKAEILGVAERTYQRWISETESAEPTPEDERVVRLVARVANQLRHSLSGLGVVDWLESPRDELQGKRPADLLDDPDAADALLVLAAATRSGIAA